MKWWIIAMTVARLGDAASFCDAHSRGFQELSPVMPNSCTGQIAVQAGEAAVQGWAAHKLAQQGHPRVAKWVMAVNVGYNGWAIQHNLRLGRRTEGSR